MDALWTTASNKKWDDSTRLKISYGILKSASKFKWFRPAFKHYLNNHVVSKFLYVEPESWAICALLPLAKFQKKNQQAVWNDSINEVNNHNQSLPKNSINRKNAKVKPKNNTVNNTKTNGKP